MENDFDTPHYNHHSQQTRGISLQFARNSLFKFKSQDSEDQMSIKQKSVKVLSHNLPHFFRLCSGKCCYNENKSSNKKFIKNNEEKCVDSSERSSYNLSSTQIHHEHQKHKFDIKNIQNFINQENDQNLQKSCININKSDENKNIINLNNLSIKKATNSIEKKMNIENNDSNKIESLNLNITNKLTNQLNDKDKNNFVIKKKRDIIPMLKYQKRIKSDEEISLFVDDTLNKTSTSSNQLNSNINNEANNLIKQTNIEKTLPKTNSDEKNVINKKFLYTKPAAHIEIELKSIEPTKCEQKQNLQTKFE